MDPAKVMLGVASNFGASMRGPGIESILAEFRAFVHDYLKIHSTF